MSDPSRAERLRRLSDEGNDAYDAGDLDRAAELFREASDLGDDDATFNLANTLRDLDRDDEAVELYRQALDACVAEAGLNFSQLLEDMGDPGEARRALECGVRLGDPGAVAQLADIHRAAGRPEQALRILRTAEDLDFRGEGVLGAVLMALNRPAEAIPRLEASRLIHPDLEIDLAVAYGLVGQAERSLSLLKALADRGEINAFLPYANALVDLAGEEEQAEAIFRRGVEAGDLHSVTNLGLLLLHHGRIDEALDLLDASARQGDPLAIRAVRRTRRRRSRARRRARRALG